MAQTTANSSNITRQLIYSDGLQESFDNNLLGLVMMNDETAAFPDGDTFNVDQIADATLTNYTENAAVNYSAITLSRITLTISDYKQDGFYETDAMKMDSWKSDLFFSKRIKRSMVAFGEQLESDLYVAANASQTAGNANQIDGLDRRFTMASTTTAQQLVDQIANIKLAFDKSNVPEVGRMLVLDPTIENLLNKLQTSAVLVSDSPRFEGLLETGFAKAHHFVRNIHGFDVFTSNLLPVSTAIETINAVAAAIGSVRNFAFSVADDDSKAMMGVIRQKPTPEFFRDTKLKRDEWSSTARYGFAAYRPESLYTLIVSV